MKRLQHHMPKTKSSQWFVQCFPSGKGATKRALRERQKGEVGVCREKRKQVCQRKKRENLKRRWKQARKGSMDSKVNVLNLNLLLLLKSSLIQLIIEYRLILYFKKWPKLDDPHHHATHFHFCPNHHWCNGVRAESTTSANTVSHTVYTVTKDHWSSAKRLNARMKHLLFEQGAIIFRLWAQQAICASVTHKKTDVYSTQAEVKFGLYEPHKCKHPEISLLTQTPKEHLTYPRSKTFQHSNRKKTTS